MMSDLDFRRANHRADVGPEQWYDVLGASQFTLMFLLGLRETHMMLDIGCGSLRGGKFFIPYLAKEHYCGIDPRRDVVWDGVQAELLYRVYTQKRPQFYYGDDFDCQQFNVRFDAVLAQSVFSHASQAQIMACLASVKSVLKDKGFMAATYMRGGANYTGDTWRWGHFATYQRGTMIGMVEQAGLQMRELVWPHPVGQQWVLITHHGVEHTPSPFCPMPLVSTKGKGSHVGCCNGRDCQLQDGASCAGGCGECAEVLPAGGHDCD